MELTITPNFAQERALNMLRRDWKENDTFMVYSPTGSGKTGLAAFIVAGFVSRGMRVLFCAPYTILIGQTANRFVEYGFSLMPETFSAPIISERTSTSGISLMKVSGAGLQSRASPAQSKTRSNAS